MEENIENIRRNAIHEIKEKIKKNPKYLHPCNKERQDDNKRLRFKNGYEFTCWMQNNGIMKNPTDVDIKHKCIDKGFKDWKEYCQDLAERDGYKCYADRARDYKHNTGRQLSMSENKGCTSHTGVVIGENMADPILIEIFGGIIEKMPYNHPGYDRIVNGGYKIDIKTANLIEEMNNGHFYECWSFSIENNNIANYFLLLALNNNRRLGHALLIHKNDMIRGRKLKEFNHLRITNSNKGILYFKKYDWINKLDCIERNEIRYIEKDQIIPILDILFEYVETKEHGNRFICKNPIHESISSKLVRDKEYKLEIREAILKDNKWQFQIRHNNTTDYFLLLGYNEDKLEYVWLLNKNDIVKKKVGGEYQDVKLCERETISIVNGSKDLLYFSRYQIKLKKEGE